MNRLILLVLVFLVGCSTWGSDPSSAFKKKEVEDVSLIIPNESASEISAPSEIQAVPGGFLVYDYGIQKVFKVDPDGKELLSFGRQGRGPGEFQELFSLWMIDDSYVVYDYSTTKFIKYDYNGRWVEDIPIKFEGFPSFPTQVVAVNTRQFVVPSYGNKGSLLTFVDTETNHIKYFGHAVGEQMKTYNPEKVRQAITSGNIPESMKNTVLMSNNETGIFSFQQATGLLEKYDFSGERLWEQSLKIPAVEGLFEHLFRKNRKEMNEGMITSFAYGIEMDANEQGSAILLNNSLLGQPVTVVWIPNDGEEITVITFSGIKNQRHQTFTISKDNPFIFFVSILDGKVYRALWPL